jgi:iron(III) transport system permease protein
VGGALAGYLIIATVLPVAAIVAECRSPAKFLAAARDAAPETANTLRAAASASVLALLAGAVVGRAAARKKSFALELATLLPVGVPALVLAMAYSLFFNRQLAVDLRALGDTSALVVLAWAARAWPFTARAIISGEGRISPEWHEAAWLARIRRWRRTWWISGPLLANQALAAALIAYVLSVGDVEISQLLCAPGQGTLALRLFTFTHFGPVHVAASLAVLQLAVAILPLVAYLLFTNRCLQVV